MQPSCRINEPGVRVVERRSRLQVDLSQRKIMQSRKNPKIEIHLLSTTSLRIKIRCVCECHLRIGEYLSEHNDS
jgi:hypothetical protein